MHIVMLHHFRHEYQRHFDSKIVQFQNNLYMKHIVMHHHFGHEYQHHFESKIIQFLNDLFLIQLIFKNRIVFYNM